MNCAVNVYLRDRVPRLLESTPLRLSNISTALRDLVHCFRYFILFVFSNGVSSLETYPRHHCHHRHCQSSYLLVMLPLFVAVTVSVI